MATATKAKAKATAPKHKTVKKKLPVKKNAVLSETSIGLVAEDRPFLEFRVTKQTLYWLVLGAVSIFFAIWIVTLDARIQKLYDEIDATAIDQPVIQPKKTVAPTGMAD